MSSLGKSAISAGMKLGCYDVLAPLGAGGMGEVWRARDTKLGRDVALKVLYEAFARDPERLERFRREAQVLASLNHPHIATIHGLEEENGVLALVLELIDGPTLTDRLAHGPIPLPEALLAARQIAEALDAAHQRGIVHRDLKPANIKLRDDGTVKILDFGLAVALDVREPLDSSASPTRISPAQVTGIGAILGTPAYMSPEQARGRAVDTRVDIWAFGCVLYEMLAGTSTFEGDSGADTIAAILDREPSWDRLPETTPAAIRRLLRRCLEKDVRRRLRDIGDAGLEIDDALDGIRDDLDPGRAPTDDAHSVEFQRLTDFVGTKESPAISPDGKMVAFVAIVDGKRQIWIRLLAGGVSLQVTRDNADHEQPRWAPDSSTLIYFTRAAPPADEGAIWEISALGGSQRRIVSAIGAGDISHDGRSIAAFQSGGSQVELTVVGRDGSRKECLISLPPEHLYTCPRWSPDDRWIAFQRAGSSGFGVHLEVVSVATRERRAVARGDWLQGFAWLPSGGGLVYSTSRGSTLLYPATFNLRSVATNGQADRQITFGDVSYVEPDVHSSGKLIVNRIRSRSDIWKFPVGGSPAENTRAALRITHQTGLAQTPSVSPDGTQVVYLSDSGGHGNLWIADGTAVRQLTFERDPAVAIGVPMWSPAGDWIVFIVAGGGQTTLSLIRPDGSELHQAILGWYSCWSSDGRWLYYTPTGSGPRRLERIPVEGGQPEVVRSSDASGTAVSADGSTIYFIHKLKPAIFGLRGDSEIRQAPADDGPSRVLARVTASRVPISPVTLQVFLSPDGQWLAMPLIDGATTNVWALPTGGGPMKKLTDFGHRSIAIMRSVSWSADSQFLYAAVAETETDVLLFDGLIPGLQHP